MWYFPCAWSTFSAVCWSGHAYLSLPLSLSESGLGHDFRAGREFISAGTSQSKVGRQRQSQAESSISRFSSVLSKYWAADLKRGGKEGGEARGCCSKARDG